MEPRSKGGRGTWHLRGGAGRKQGEDDSRHDRAKHSPRVLKQKHRRSSIPSQMIGAIRNPVRPPEVWPGRPRRGKRNSDSPRKYVLSMDLPLRSPIAQGARWEPGERPPHIAETAGWRPRAL